MVECISNVIGKVLVEKGSILNSFFKLSVNYDYDYNYDYALIVGEKYFVLGGFVKIIAYITIFMIIMCG